MAIRIPILTSFDPKGLKQANAAFANLQSSMSSLGRNFAIVGAGIAGTTALLGKAVMSASNFEAEFEGVNQVFKDAAGSVQDFAETAAATAGLSATEALRAAKTFGLFATGAGLSVQEASKFSTTLVQLAGDLGSFNDLPTADALAAIQSGLMGQAEPLRVFGVFLDDLSLKNELFEMTGQKVTGTLTSQQKMIAAYSQILKDTTVQQGDFVKYQETLGNQLKIVDKEFQNLIRDIGMILIPVIAEAMPVIRAMAVEIGEKLKNAISSIDWKATIEAVVNFATFLVVNAEAISKLVAAIFILNTAFKLMAVASGITTVAIKLQGWVTAQLATGMTVATVATTLLSAAMRLIPFVAIATGIGLIVNGVMNLGNEAGKSQHNVRILNGQITTGGEAAWESANKYVKVGGAFKLIETSADSAADAVDGLENVLSPNQASNRQRRNELREANRQARAARNAIGFTMPDFSALLSSATSGAGSGDFQAELDRLAREAEKAAKDAADAMSDIERQAQAERQAALAAEQAVLDQRQRAYQSFANSVKSLFGQIKDSILSSFNLPTLGNSVNSITRNIGKLLEKTKGFASDITQLSGLGLNSALLQQVIQAGPVAGSRLASAIVGGGSAFISQLNSAYGEMGGLASGIAGVGTRSAFDNPTIANTYNIEVNGGVGSGPTIGKAIVDAIKSYERTSGAVWQGA
jgi:hypothetical protein